MDLSALITIIMMIKLELYLPTNNILYGHTRGHIYDFGTPNFTYD